VFAASEILAQGALGDGDESPPYLFCSPDRIGDCADGGRNPCSAVELRAALDFYPERDVCFRVHHKHKHLAAWADPYRAGVLYL